MCMACTAPRYSVVYGMKLTERDSCLACITGTRHGTRAEFTRPRYGETLRGTKQKNAIGSMIDSERNEIARHVLDMPVTIQHALSGISGVNGS